MTHNKQTNKQTNKLAFIYSKLINKNFMFFLLFSFFQLFPFSSVFAQTSPLYLTWDFGVGCQFSDNPLRHKTYLELMQSNECLQVCQGSEVVYTLEQYSTNWQNITWNVIGGVVLPSTSNYLCKVRWNNEVIVGSIGATITTANGVLTLPSLCVEILRRPFARFDKAPFNLISFNMTNLDTHMEACTDEVIHFADGSTDNGGTAIINWHWDFGDGTTSTEQNPTHSYHAMDTYTITLTVSSACNCKKEFSRKIDVGKKGVAISCPGVVCEGQRVTYKVVEDFERAPDPNCGTWSIIGGEIISSTHGDTVVVDWTETQITNQSPPNDGFGYIKFNPLGCTTDCYVPTTLKIPIIKKRMPISGDAIVCGNGQQRYSMPQWPTTNFEWEIIQDEEVTNADFILDDQRNEIILLPGDKPGVITLRVVYQNTLLNCGGSSEMTITLKREAVIVGASETCVGSTEVFTTEGGFSCNWQLKKLPSGPVINSVGSSFTTTFATTGDYTLTVSNENYCTQNPTLIRVKNIPTPLLSEIVHNLPYVCPSTPSVFSITNTIPNTTIGWKVPDNIGTIVGPSYGDDVQVVFYSPIPANAAYLIKVWRESTNPPFCKTPELVVPLEIRPMDLMVTGETSPCGSTYKEYEVPETHGDLYEWSISPPDKGSIVSILEGGRRVRVLWNQYAANTNASLKLKVTECGITRVVTPYPVTIITSPILSILPNAPSICRDVSQTFTVNGIPDLSAYDSITWNFGDGSDPEIGPTVSHQYTVISDQVVTYPVTVTVVNPNGCGNSITQTTQVTVQVAPVASISPAGSYVYCTGETVNLALTATVQSGFGATTQVVWYKNGVALAPLTGINNNYTITTPGSYYAQVSNGTCETQTNTVTVAVETCIAECATNNHLTLITTTSCGVVSATATYDGTPTIEWMGVGLQPNATPTQASYVFNQAGDFIIGYTATYTNASGQTCKATKQTAVQVPYIADLKYSITCGATSGTYTVQLLDHSNYNTQTPINNWEFKVGTTIMPRLAGDLANTRTLTMTPGTYTVRLTITGANLAPCYKEVTLVLPDMPNATFEVARLFCQGEVTHFSTPPQANVTYYWDFYDNSYNTQANPDREYQFGSYLPKLTVKNQYGCTVTSIPDTSNPIVVNKNDQIVEIDTPTFGCPGGETSLIYQQLSTTTIPATSCQWLYNNQPIVGATTNPYTLQGAALQSGSYSVIVGNQFGCKKQMAQSVPVAVVKPAIRNINGPSVICYGPEVTFSVLSGSATNLVYHWSDENGPTVNTENFLKGMWEVGDHTLYLTIDTPTADGGFCSNTLSHSFTVVAPPLAPTIQILDMKCNPYHVRLFIDSSEEGATYNWSNGMTGNDIHLDHGGIFEVTFTNSNGCKSSATVNVPKNPENYLWIFPYGCYTFCEKLDGTLIGPALAEFTNWQWQTDDTTTAHNAFDGASEVVDNVLYTNDSNTYNLVLQNDPNPDCAIKSKDMVARVIACDCHIVIYPNETPAMTHVMEPYEYYTFNLNISNTTGNPYTVILTTLSSLGVLQPSSITVPVGGGNFDFTFIPNTENYIPESQIKIEATAFSGIEPCFGHLQFYPTISDGGFTSTRLQLEEVPSNSLKVVPNPVKDKVTFEYDYGVVLANGDPRMAIYDVLGRELDYFVPTESKSSWSLDMSGYQAGHYIVVMRLHGVLVQQQNIVVTH